MRQTPDRLAASVYVVADVNNLGQRTAWCLAVGGRVAITPEYLYTLGEAGPCLAFCPATHSKRRVWISPAFAAAHPTLTLIIRIKAMHPMTKWTFSESRALILDLGRRRAAGGHGNEVLIFVTLAEHIHPEPQYIK